MSAFDLYAPFIQDYIYQNQWRSLRGIQVAAADVIFKTDQNLLLTASTASGKTEAVFFPIISQFYEDPPKSVGCIYIGPLKALINDQFERLTNLCEDAGVPVWHWHGDVSQNHKEKVLKKPSGILQITPESLEALLLRKHSAVPRLFHDLRYIVIDEVHSLLRGDRGGQTICLIERLTKLANINPRRIGLSATIGDPEEAGRFLSLGTGRKTIIPKVPGKGSQWRISMEHFYITESYGDKSKSKKKSKEQSDEKSVNYETGVELVDLGKQEVPTGNAPKGADKGLGYIFDHTRDKKCLVFVNSREQCESVTTSLRSYCEKNHEVDRFLIHHGNLSASYRQMAEDAMKDESKNLTTITTSTLELGIDIGRLERAFQIDAPWSVSSFLQRMGRTGRRDLPSEMWFVMREEIPDPREPLPSTIPWKLLQGIALVQLYIEDRWVEPPRLNGLPYSLLYHQTMSTLASCGEMSPRKLAESILTLHYFHRVTQEDYKILLRYLIKEEHIQKTEQGGLIVGINGERVINSFRFYGVFQENEEYKVRDDSQELGTVVYPPPVGEKLAIAGQVWEVLEIDHKRHFVYVRPVKGIVPAYFGECAGDLHTRILERMRKVLQEDKVYPYLLENAVARLAKTRLVATRSGVANNVLVNLGGYTWCLFPWLGTYAFLAMERLLKIRCRSQLGIRDFDAVRPYYMMFSMKATEKEFFQVISDEVKHPIDPMTLLYPTESPRFDKYDDYLPKDLLRKGFAQGVLDIEGMRKRIFEWKDMYLRDC